MLTSLDLVRGELRQDEIRIDISTAADERFILSAIDHVQSRIDRFRYFRPGQRTFAPVLDTRYYTALPVTRRGDIIDNVLHLGSEAVEVLAVTVHDDPVDPSLWRAQPRNDRHKTSIRFTSSDAWRVTEDPHEAIGVTALWAYREYVSEAWEDSLDTVQATISAADKTISVDDVDGETDTLRRPRFSPGQLLRVDQEFMQVVGVDADNDTISVRRGVNKTDRAIHEQGASIDIWRAQPDIERAATRWVTLLYRRRGEFTTTEVEGMSEIRWPKDMPPDVYEVLLTYVQVGKVRSI